MDSSSTGILLIALFLIFLIRYLFTGSIRTKYEDEPYAYKIARKITLTVALFISVIGIFLYSFEFYNFSLSWFIIITFISFIVIDIFRFKIHETHKRIFN